MTRAQQELDELFARMRAEDAPVLSAEDEADREARVAAHIDHTVASLARAPQRWTSPKRVAILLAAACLPLVAYAASRARRDPVAWIAREPAMPSAASAKTGETPAAHDGTTREETKNAAGARPPTSPRTLAGPHANEPATPTQGPVSPLKDGLPNAAQAPGAPASDDPANATQAPAGAKTGSTLSEENRLFQDAARAERAGDDVNALDALDRLVRDFPRSPLAQNAMVRKFHLLLRAGRRDEAAAAARVYLRAYPLGFATREAEGVANGTEGAGPMPNRE